ncbi:hypothetical protein EDB83DRAFT_2535797 [Lactarius deliciosus]|nr:hypothetical protein EDB83DRAFT_2535797 [Lactarius deliciosus]
MSLGTLIVNNTPTFTVEQWIVDPNPPIHTLCSNLKKVICYHTSDWTHAVSQPYSIDITCFYVLNTRENEVRAATAVLERLLGAWEYETDHVQTARAVSSYTPHPSTCYQEPWE